tara:strand:+ start:657 stop:842 length:186 start_codon:yes stop_codon:yes gene_type:complete
MQEEQKVLQQESEEEEKAVLKVLAEIQKRVDRMDFKITQSSPSYKEKNIYASQPTTSNTPP